MYECHRLWQGRNQSPLREALKKLAVGFYSATRGELYYPSKYDIVKQIDVKACGDK